MWCQPCVQLADQAGIAVPLRRGFAEIFGVLLGVDPWKCGPLLADMDLEGTPAAVKKGMLGRRDNNLSARRAWQLVLKNRR